MIMSEGQQADVFPVIRLTEIELEHFNNVERGKIALSSWEPGDRITSDIIGIYGQNGSGKTSVILALKILQNLFLGAELPNFTSDCLGVGHDSFSISVSGFWGNGRDADNGSSVEEKALFSYGVEIAPGKDTLFVRRERLSLKPLGISGSSFRSVFDYSVDPESPKGFTLKPKTLWEGMLNSAGGLGTDLAVAQRICAKEGTSFLFSDGMMSLLWDRLSAVYDSWRRNERDLSKRAEKALSDLYSPLSESVLALRIFSYSDMAIVSTVRQVGLAVNMLRISTHEGEYGRFADNSFRIDISKPYLATKDQLEILDATVSTVRKVLAALIPGLSLDIKRLGTALNDEGETVESVELVVARGDVTVPLRSESEGVKKLVSILVMLVDVYSKPGACVAIDELDSGLFEFLLGEILQVLQEHGKGQLIFTAHDLRPLETLDKGSLVFTTTNPSNRYTTFKGSGATNNLRSQYLRAINLGGQPETIYEPTSKFEIDSAFYDASCTAHESR